MVGQTSGFTGTVYYTHDVGTYSKTWDTIIPLGYMLCFDERKSVTHVNTHDSYLMGTFSLGPVDVFLQWMIKF